jgi:hypothetical protein
MYAVYDLHKGRKAAEEIARMGVIAGAEYDTGTSLPIDLAGVEIECQRSTFKPEGEIRLHYHQYGWMMMINGFGQRAFFQNPAARY